jgi:hypothetical protein
MILEVFLINILECLSTPVQRGAKLLQEHNSSHDDNLITSVFFCNDHFIHGRCGYDLLLSLLKKCNKLLCEAVATTFFFILGPTSLSGEPVLRLSNLFLLVCILRGFDVEEGVELLECMVCWINNVFCSRISFCAK